MYLRGRCVIIFCHPFSLSTYFSWCFLKRRYRLEDVALLLLKSVDIKMRNGKLDWVTTHIKRNKMGDKTRKRVSLISYFSSASRALSRASWLTCSSSKYTFFSLSNSFTQLCNSLCTAFTTSRFFIGNTTNISWGKIKMTDPNGYLTFLASCSLFWRTILTSSTICWWKISTAASFAFASLSVSSNRDRHTDQTVLWV